MVTIKHKWHEQNSLGVKTRLQIMGFSERVGNTSGELNHLANRTLFSFCLRTTFLSIKQFIGDKNLNFLMTQFFCNFTHVWQLDIGPSSSDYASRSADDTNFYLKNCNRVNSEEHWRWRDSVFQLRSHWDQRCPGYILYFRPTSLVILTCWWLAHSANSVKLKSIVHGRAETQYVPALAFSEGHASAASRRRTC